MTETVIDLLALVALILFCGWVVLSSVRIAWHDFVVAWLSSTREHKQQEVEDAKQQFQTIGQVAGGLLLLVFIACRRIVRAVANLWRESGRRI